MSCDQKLERSWERAVYRTATAVVRLGLLAEGELKCVSGCLSSDDFLNHLADIWADDTNLSEENPQR